MKQEIKEPTTTSPAGLAHGYTRRATDSESCAQGEKCKHRESRRAVFLFLNRRTKKPTWVCGQCARSMRII
jgi:hypothetical protein